jgi:putative phage-type endonuclease
MLNIVNCEQQTPEWFKIREKRMTASHASEIAKCGKGLITYTRTMMQEFFSSAEKKYFENRHTKRGNTYEDSAGFLYSIKKEIETEKVGFVIHSDYVGCSPDLFAGEDGLSEIKCPDDPAYFQLLDEGEIDEKYIWQMQMQMLICEKKWCDFVAYNPNFPKATYIERVYPDQDRFDKLKKGFAEGERLIKNLESKMNHLFHGTELIEILPGKDPVEEKKPKKKAKKVAPVKHVAVKEKSFVSKLAEIVDEPDYKSVIVGLIKNGNLVANSEQNDLRTKEEKQAKVTYEKIMEVRPSEAIAA